MKQNNTHKRALAEYDKPLQTKGGKKKNGRQSKRRST